MTSARPTSVRYLVLAATALVSVFMYVDRVCLAGVKGDVQKELALTDPQMDWVLSAFFWSYALAQVFAGALALRFGFRHTLAAYLFLWSLFTVTTGLATGLIVLLASRLLVGMTEAGAYPTAASLVKNWFPVSRRGMANSTVALGGRLGGAIGQRITPLLVVMLAGTFTLSGWRMTLIVFGVIGMAYAVVFWLIARDSAAEHPWSNEAEAALTPDTFRRAANSPFPWLAILNSRNLWLSGVTQFGINIGWAFLVTQWPDYLEKEHNLTGDIKGYWASWPLTVGIAGMFVGGFLTDSLTKRVGLRWGRALPIGVSLFLCSAGYAISAIATDYRLVVAMLCVMTVFVDVGVPSIWAFAQDIGGRHVGPALGWANMWGNIGAAICPLLLGFMQREFGWSAVFATCAVSFAGAAVCGLLLNATVPLDRKDGE